MDVSKKADVDGMMAFALAHYGGIDVLINNAGLCREERFLEIPEESWDETININLKGHFLVAQAVAREMVKAGSGTIVNMSSTNGLVGEAGHAAITHPKAASFCRRRPWRWNWDLRHPGELRCARLYRHPDVDGDRLGQPDVHLCP